MPFLPAIKKPPVKPPGLYKYRPIAAWPWNKRGPNGVESAHRMPIPHPLSHIRPINASRPFRHPFLDIIAAQPKSGQIILKTAVGYAFIFSVA